MRKKYRHRPIEEAVVEFRFGPGQEWDLTIPGKFHEHPCIKEQYKGKPRTQQSQQLTFQTRPGQPLNLVLHGVIGRIQLVDLAGRNLISLGADVLSVNTLRPYDSWEEFRPRIEAALRAYSEIARPTDVSRVGVRYINKIVVPGTKVDFGIYVQSGLRSVPGLPSKVDGILSRTEYVYDDAVKLLLTQGTVDAPEEQSAFVIDIDVVRDDAEAKELDAIMNIVDDLHKREGKAFEAIITDAARRVFDAD